MKKNLKLKLCFFERTLWELTSPRKSVWLQILGKCVNYIYHYLWASNAFGIYWLRITDNAECIFF